MHAKFSDRPVEQIVAAIQALDLESVKVRITDSELGEGWTREYAVGIEHAYKNYLTMVAKYQDHAEDILLSKDVDEFWHTHILQTIKYTKDCDAVFGKYLHHAPHIGERTLDDFKRRDALAEKTRRLYQQEFQGEQDHEAAWFGDSIETKKSTQSEVILAEKAAYSGAIRADEAAYSGAIRADKAAYSGAIRADKAAYSGVIRVDEAAYSGAIRADKAAYSGAIRADEAAYSGAIRADKAAYSGAIRADKAAYSGAIRADKAAYSGAVSADGTARAQNVSEVGAAAVI